MRLIDIERLVDDYYKEKRDLHNVTWFEMTKYEVKAIPIEWIDNYLSKWKNAETHDVAKIWWLIMKRDWEKENEID